MAATGEVPEAAIIIYIDLLATELIIVFETRA